MGKIGTIVTVTTYVVVGVIYAVVPKGQLVTAVCVGVDVSSAFYRKCLQKKAITASKKQLIVVKTFRMPVKLKEHFEYMLRNLIIYVPQLVII